MIEDNSREWERVIGVALAREAMKAERDAMTDIGAEKWVWDAVKPTARDHVPDCGGARMPEPTVVAAMLSAQAKAALSTAWRTREGWRVSKDNARLLRPHGICEAGRGVYLSNYGCAVHRIVAPC